MGAVFVPDVLTPISLEGLAGALCDGHRAVMGSEFPSSRAMACGFAQLCLECGNGEKAHCWNFHNEKLGSDWDGLFTRYRCDELFDAATAAYARRLDPAHCIVTPWKDGKLERCVLTPPHPWTAFVAFVDAGAGAARYIAFLSCRERYRMAWHAMRQGDPFAFVHELHAAGYMTAEEAVYARGVVSIVNRSLPLCDDLLAGKLSLFSDEDRAHVAAIVAETAASNLIWMPERHQELAA